MKSNLQNERISWPHSAAMQNVQHVVYWMQQAQRAEMNHALNMAVDIANDLHATLDVVFVLTGSVPEANLRHYRFMLEGLAETAERITDQGMPFHFLAGDPVKSILALAGNSILVVADRGYLNWQRNWRLQLVQSLPPGHFCEVESDVVVPVQTASDKEEYAAATIRGKILRHLENFLKPAPVHNYTLKRGMNLPAPADLAILSYRKGMDPGQLNDFAHRHLVFDSSVVPVKAFTGGISEANKLLETFLDKRLRLYSEQRNNPAAEIQSGLSPYLHFGQISSLDIAWRALEHCGVPVYAAPELIRAKSGLPPEQAGLAAFLEELIVRRELSCNFCFYNQEYDNYQCVPMWARKTLNDHLGDPRPDIYSLEELETARTVDPYWNAAQTEMVKTGKMHNYMRMYWGKKIIEWSPDPETAYEVMLYLNNKYSLDGRDPNSYAGIAWCFGKHDRPWQSRAIFGSVRYMNSHGLRRKFDMQGYLQKIAGFS